MHLVCTLQEGALTLQSAYRYLRLPAGLHTHEPFCHLVQRATARVQAEFDDLDAVWMSESLQADFLRLPFPALLVCSALSSTVNSCCKDTRCKDNLDVRTTPLVTNHCVLTAVIPLSKGHSMFTVNLLVTKAVVTKRVHCSAVCPA